jgi:hypothetical protein
MAHIVAHSNDGPRADPSYPAEQRATYDNLILLCPTHHTRVDKQANSYTIENLRSWKSDHEAWVRKRLVEEMPNITFAELELVMTGIASMPASPSEQFSVTPPAEKLERNGLSGRVRQTLQMGLAVAPEVERFVDHITTIQPDFPERVKAGFVQEYTRQRAEGISGDALFAALHAFAVAGSNDFARQAAAFAVLGYLFMKCEVFEP